MLIKLLKIWLCIPFIFGASYLRAGPTNFSVGFWHLNSLNTRLGMESEYRSQKTVLKSGPADFPKSTQFNGRFQSNSSSYLWHPNFLLLHTDIEYYPGVKQESFAQIPNRAESKTAEKIDVRTIFFDDRPLSVTFFSNWNHNFINRDFSTDVEMHRVDYGARLAFRNKFVPLILRYSKNRWKQKELQTGREFLDNHRQVGLEANKSFTRRDQHRLTYSYDDYSRDYAANGLVENRVSAVNLQNTLFLNGVRESQFNSTIWVSRQTGYSAFSRWFVNEQLNYKLPKNFKFRGSYQFTEFEQNAFNFRQHTLRGNMRHQLFLSLNSQIFYEYSHLDQTALNEKIRYAGIALDYQKKIPTGRLNLFFEYRLRGEERDSAPQILRVVDEIQTLDDDRRVLLKNQFVDPGSVVVSDATGIIIYQENLDYLILPWGDFLEIQRLPGGQIADGATVYVDYLARPAASQSQDALNNIFGGRIFLFNHFLEIHYRYFEQDYRKIRGNNPGILKYINQDVFGVRLSRGPATLGAERDDFRSTIVPYRSLRYYFSLSGALFRKINYAFTGNWREYKFSDSGEKQEYTDIFGRLNYRLNRQTRVNIEGSYRVQQGRRVDLNLSNALAEVVAGYRQVSAALGVQIYRRDFHGETINFERLYLRLERSF